MDSLASLTPIVNTNPVVDRGNGFRIEEPEPCVVCGRRGAQKWLRAPDRLHGRREEYTLVRCPACMLVWLNSPPRPEEMHLHYTDAYDRLISASGNKTSNRWKQRKETLAEYKQSGTLLDLGCSSGSFLESMRSGSWQLCGIEMSAGVARKAEARTGARVFVGDILDAPFSRERFDVITCFDVFEHLYDPRKVMTKVEEWLKPGGIFYVQVPNIESAEARTFGRYWHGLELPRHLFHYSPACLKLLAETAGLQVVILETRRNFAVGTSLRYVFDDVFRAIGIRQTPVAYRGEAGLLWRAVRKLVRVTVLRCLRVMAPLVGGGESIHAIFRKAVPHRKFGSGRDQTSSTIPEDTI
jgi:SAM-dependent methyltransferase